MDKQKNKVRRKIDETQEILEKYILSGQVNVMLSVMGMRGKMFTSKVSKQMTLKSYDEDGVEDYFLVYEVFVNPYAFKKYDPQTLAKELILDYKIKTAKL